MALVDLPEKGSICNEIRKVCTPKRRDDFLVITGYSAAAIDGDIQFVQELQSLDRMRMSVSLSDHKR